MPTGQLPCRPIVTAGFTLIELVAVLAIIALLFTFVALSTGTTVDDRLKVEAKRIQLLMGYASEEALLSGTEVGAILSEEGYQFLQLTAEGWQPYSGRHPLRERRLPKGISLKRTDEAAPKRETAERFSLGSINENAEDKDKKKEQEKPELLFLSTGELTPFELQLNAQGYEPSFMITGAIDGKLRLISPGDQARKTTP